MILKSLMFMYLFECHQTAEFVGDVTATNLYTIPQVNDKFTKLTDGAPQTLNTLNKLVNATCNTNVSITGGTSTRVTDDLTINRILLSSL